MLFSAVLPSAFLLASTLPPVLAAANDWDQQSRPFKFVDDDPDDDITNNRNSRYTAALTINGKAINVILDTGSTDLWLNPVGGVGPFENTGVTHQINYGEGATFINGTIGLGDIEIAGHRIPRQAFINVTQNVGLNECGGGICGLVGLGFDSPNGGIEKALSNGGIDPSVGKSVLSSIFDMSPTPEKDRFFAISLSRLGDEKGSADASINIGEYDSDYVAVQYEARRPVFPPTATSWRVLADGVTMNGVAIPWSAKGTSTPSGKKIVLLDTGTTNILMRPEIRDSIYSKVPGAVLAKNSSLHNVHWSSDRDVWVVPCNASLDFSAVFGGQPYPIHPLDMTDMYTKVGPNGVNYTVCVGRITNGGTITSGSTDALFGDTFLRNVYTVYSFGDKTTSPYVQFLSQTKMWDAAVDFAAVRQQLLAASPAEIAPADLVRIFDEDHHWSDEPTAAGPSATARVNLADADSPNTDSSSSLNKYGPIIIGLLAANLIVVLVLLALGVLVFVRKGRTSGPTRAASARYVPAKTRDDSLMRPSFAEDRPYSDRETQ
ncbi:aspartic peptidase domain-containing protein [Mycena crocata]|nr:aspartic peptidase domain-containing protein [Mycena crocata]